MKPFSVATLTAVAFLGLAQTTQAKSSANTTAMTGVEAVQKNTEGQIRNLIEPLLEKYCRDECRLMSVFVTVDVNTPETASPGFEDYDPKSLSALAPASAKAKLLIDEKFGSVSRTKLIDLIQQYLDTLDYPVKIDTQVSSFPQQAGSASKVAELREKITKQFRSTLDDLFRQYCPEQCLLADYELHTEFTNAEEAQYGSGGEYVEDNGIALRIKKISGTLLLDEALPAAEQAGLLQMARLKTNYYKNVNLEAKSLRFPKPGSSTGADGLEATLLNADGTIRTRGLSSEKSTEQKNSELKTQSQIQNQTQTKDKTESQNTSKTQTQLQSQTKNENTNATNNSENSSKNERIEKYEKIERVENGDAVQAELQKFKVYGLIFACSVLSLLIFVAMAVLKPRSGGSRSSSSKPLRILRDLRDIAGFGPETHAGKGPSDLGDPTGPSDRSALVAKRYEIERLTEELMAIYAQNPKVAKQVFSRVLTEEGVEVTSAYIQIFGESIVMDMLRDPSLQSDLNDLMEYYAKNPIELSDTDKLELLKKLHNRTVAGKLVVMGSRSSNLFDFLVDMDGQQIMELIRNESLTVKSIVLTQCDTQKRTTIYAQMEPDHRMRLLTELSRIDYLPRDYIYNVANALKRKRRENPKLNTEALPGSDVLLNLLERTTWDVQRNVIRNLELSNPDSARMIKAKLISVDTLCHLRDGQLLEVVLSLRHDELLLFLKGAPEHVRQAIFTKSPRDLTADLEEELSQVKPLSREAYAGIERKVLNRLKIMANEGLINLVETNDRMLSEGAYAPASYAGAGSSGDAPSGPPSVEDMQNALGDPPTVGVSATQPQIKKASGW